MKKIIVFFLAISLVVMLNSSSFAEAELITYEQLINYGQLYENDGKKGKVLVKIEAVIGDAKIETDSFFPDTFFDVWIKGENGYGYIDEKIIGVLKKETSFPHEIIPGQRVVYELLPNVDGSFIGSSIISYEIIEEGVDYKAIEAEYKSSHYELIPYKKLLRNIVDYKGKTVCIEGTYFQEAEQSSGYIYGLLMDDEANVYCFLFLPDKLDSRVLLDDRLKVYGNIAPKTLTYKYLSLTGYREVPLIWVDFIDILEED